MPKLFDVYAGITEKNANVYYVWGMDAKDARNWFARTFTCMTVYKVKEHEGNPKDVPWTMGADRTGERKRRRYIEDALDLVKANKDGFEKEMADITSRIAAVYQAMEAVEEAMQHLEHGFRQYDHSIGYKLIEFLDGVKPKEENHE